MDKPNIKQALDIVELEDRFAMTVASVDTGRCGGNKVELSTDATTEPS